MKPSKSELGTSYIGYLIFWIGILGMQSPQHLSLPVSRIIFLTSIPFFIPGILFVIKDSWRNLNSDR